MLITSEVEGLLAIRHLKELFFNKDSSQEVLGPIQALSDVGIPAFRGSLDEKGYSPVEITVALEVREGKLEMPKWRFVE